MADTTYTLQLIDQATGAARKVKRALDNVDRAAERSANAFRGTDRAYRGVSREAERLARIELKLARSLATSSAAAVRNSRSMDRLTGKTKGAATSVKGLGAFATAAGAAMAVHLGAGAVAAGVGLVRANGEAELLRDTFNRVAGDKTEFPAIQKQIRDLGIDLVSGEKAALNLRTAFGKITTSKFLSLFKAAQLTAEQTRGVAVQLNQIKGRDLLQGENLNTIVEQIPGLNRGAVAKAVAKEMNIGLSKASKLLDSGKLDAGIGIRALFEGTVSALKIGNLDEFNKTLSDKTPTRLANIANDITDAKRNLGKALESTSFLSLLEGVAGALVWITKLMSPSQLGSVMKALAIGVGVLTVGFVALGVKAAIGWAAMLGPITLIIAGVAALATGASLLWDQFQRLQTLGGFGEFFDRITTQFPKVTAVVEQLIKTFVPFLRILDAINFASNLFGSTPKAPDMPFAMFDGKGQFIDENLQGVPDAGEGLDFMSQSSTVEAATANMAGPSSASVSHMTEGAAAGLSRTSRGGSVGKVEVNIQVDGSKDPAATGKSVKDQFETAMGAFFERHLEGVGA